MRAQRSSLTGAGGTGGRVEDMEREKAGGGRKNKQTHKQTHKEDEEGEQNQNQKQNEKEKVERSAAWKRNKAETTTKKTQRDIQEE